MDPIAAVGRPKGWRRRRLKARLRRAARLLRGGELPELDYALIALSTIYELQGVSPRGRELRGLGFSVDAADALGIPLERDGHTELEEYGPLGSVTATILDGNLDTGWHIVPDDPTEMCFTWGTEFSEAHKRALVRLTWSGRSLERLDQWIGNQSKMAPHATPALGRIILVIGTAIVSFLAGRCSAPG